MDGRDAGVIGPGSRKRQGLGRTERAALAALETWRTRFEIGALKPRMLWPPPLQDGERFGGWIAGVGVAGSGYSVARGAVFFTDRRAFLSTGRRQRASRFTPAREWPWAEVDSVVVSGRRTGVRLSCGGNDDVLTNALTNRPPPRRGVQWLQLEGAFALAQRRGEEWLREVAERLASTPL
ncbi:MAG: hypothetical protein ACLP8S_08915 [Solirubrobacteraceae bacterium]